MSSSDGLKISFDVVQVHLVTWGCRIGFTIFAHRPKIKVWIQSRGIRGGAGQGVGRTIAVFVTPRIDNRAGARRGQRSNVRNPTLFAADWI